MAEDAVLSRQDFLWLAASLCRLHRLPFDEALLLQQCPPPHSLSQLEGALAALGLTLRKVRLDSHSSAGPPVPFLAVERPGPVGNPVPQQGASATAGTDVGSRRGDGLQQVHTALATLVLIVRHEGGRILFFPAGSDRPRTLPAEEFRRRYRPEVLVVERALPELAADGAAIRSGLGRRPFGFRWFVPALLRHRAIWRDVVVASLVMQLLGLGLPLFTQVIIDKVVVHRTLSTLQVVGAGMAIAVLFSAGMGWIRQQLVLYAGSRVDAVLGSAVFRHLLHLPLSYFRHRPTGTLIARLQGIDTIREFITGAAVSLVLDLPFMLVFLAVMFFYSWPLTLIALGLVVLLAGISLAVAPLLRQRLNQQFLLGARNQSYVTEHVAGMETVKSLQMEPQLEARYDRYLASYLDASYRTRSLANTYQVLCGTLEQMQTLAILVVGALLVMRQDGFTVGMLVAFQMFASRLAQPILRLTGLYQEFQQASIAVRRLADLMDCPTEPHGLAPSRRGEQRGRIEIAGLGFRYDASGPWLYRGLDLTIPAGKTVALMGPSGCGKSTLVKLLLGFVQPTEGVVKVDGIDTRFLSANELRSLFGVVPQDTVLFSGTLYDNLVAAAPSATFEDIETACRMAGIHEFIQHLPQGYQSEVGEKGAGLAGGQKQRLAIARALLRRPRILIFDEATSHLDQATAEAFARTINQLKGQATVIFITHHLPKELLVDGVVSLDTSTANSRHAMAP